MSIDPLTAAFIAVEDNADLLRGPEGPQGPQGEPGADGADGRDGPPGPQGEPGQDGRDGKDGADGKDGKDGRSGPQGIEGPEGMRGPKGDKGKQGDPGPAGGNGANMRWVPTATPSLSGVLAVGNDAGGRAIVNLADPTNAQDAATKAYVLAHAGGGGLPTGWVETADGVEVTDISDTVTFLKVLRQNSTATGNVLGTEVFAAFLRIYNSILLDDAALIAKNDNGNTFFELDTSANAGDGAVKVHGSELTDGADGADGTSGTSFLTGVGIPDDSTVGIDGDSYLDTSTGDIYGPKASGVWGDPTPLTVPAVVPDTAYDTTGDVPTLVQGSGSATVVTASIRSKRIGREVHARVYALVDSATGETGEAWVLTLPAAVPLAENAALTAGTNVAGFGYIAATGVVIPVTAVWSGPVEGTRGLKLIGPGGEVGSTMDLQLGTGDSVTLNLVYEAADAA